MQDEFLKLMEFNLITNSHKIIIHEKNIFEKKMVTFCAVRIHIRSQNQFNQFNML